MTAPSLEGAYSFCTPSEGLARQLHPLHGPAPLGQACPPPGAAGWGGPVMAPTLRSLFLLAVG